MCKNLPELSEFVLDQLQADFDYSVEKINKLINVLHSKLY